MEMKFAGMSGMATIRVSENLSVEHRSCTSLSQGSRPLAAARCSLTRPVRGQSRPTVECPMLGEATERFAVFRPV